MRLPPWFGLVAKVVCDATLLNGQLKNIFSHRSLISKGLDLLKRKPYAQSGPSIENGYSGGWYNNLRGERLSRLNGGSLTNGGRPEWDGRATLGIQLWSSSSRLSDGGPRIVPVR